MQASFAKGPPRQKKDQKNHYSETLGQRESLPLDVKNSEIMVFGFLGFLFWCLWSFDFGFMVFFGFGAHFLLSWFHLSKSLRTMVCWCFWVFYFCFFGLGFLAS